MTLERECPWRCRSSSITAWCTSPTGSARTRSTATCSAPSWSRGRTAGPTASATTQLNLHGPGFKPAEVARLPVQPGNSDLCFEWDGPIADAIAHLERCSVPIDAGPMRALRRAGRRHQRLFPRPRRLAAGIHLLSASRWEACHDDRTRSQRLADGPSGRRRTMAARAISQGCRLPVIAARGDRRRRRSICRSSPAAPWSTSIRAPACPGRRRPTAGTQIPGARGCTPQSCSFRDHFAELKRLGVAQLYGLSTQDTAYQREAVERLHLPFPILSDAEPRADARDQAADLHGRRHDAAQAHGAGDRRRRRSRRCSIRCFRRTRTPRT